VSVKDGKVALRRGRSRHSLTLGRSGELPGMSTYLSRIFPPFPRVPQFFLCIGTGHTGRRHSDESCDPDEGPNRGPPFFLIVPIFGLLASFSFFSGFLFEAGSGLVRLSPRASSALRSVGHLISLPSLPSFAPLSFKTVL